MQPSLRSKSGDLTEWLAGIHRLHSFLPPSSPFWRNELELIECVPQLLSVLGKEERVVDQGWEVDWPAYRAAEPGKFEAPGQRLEHLVSPAGSSGAMLALVLHFPTFHTRRPNNGDMFDRTNPTITRLAESGFNNENAFWLDQFWRRKQATLKDKKRFQPRKHVEPAVLSHHHEWLYLCLRNSAAKVLVIFGQENEALFKKKWGERLREMPLWGNYKGESLWLLFPEHNDSRLERVFLFVWHPEHIGRSK